MGGGQCGMGEGESFFGGIGGRVLIYEFSELVSVTIIYPTKSTTPF